MRAVYFKVVILTVYLLLNGFETARGEERIPLGLTLSGGGAKGMAHIGVLHLIDSLGIQVDYIAGTSMGSIVGAMYASGYSAAEIEDFAINLEWESLFSSQAELIYAHPRKRESFGKYILQLPIENGRLRFPSGAIEGQQLWNLLGEVFFHVRNIDDFTQFPIPFTCVATDVATGEGVILNNGDIVRALRASMAIPSIFTTVEINDRKLIDGGVVNNFPVQVALDMGAGKVIGVNVSQGLRTADELRTPVDIIYQMGFFLDAINFDQNRELVDVFIQPDLENFTAASFQDVKSIIEQGKKAARKQMDLLISIARSNPSEQQKTTTCMRLSQEASFVIDTIVFKGLKNVRPWFVRNTTPLSSGDTLNMSLLNNTINRLFATDYFSRITYNYLPGEQEDHGTLVFDFIEKPFVSLGTAVHYSSFTGVGLIGSVSTNKFLLYNTGAYVKGQLGEKPALKAGIDIFTSDRQNTWFNVEGLTQYIIFPLYENFRNVAEYRQWYFRLQGSFYRLTGLNSYFSIGSAWYYQRLAPNMEINFPVRGHNISNKIFVNWDRNSLNRRAFAQHGNRFSITSAWVFNQNPSLSFRDSEGNISYDLAELGIEMNDYLQVTMFWESYVSPGPRLTSFTRLQAGYNFFYNQRFLNMFNMGGTYPFLKNQITFAGLSEYGLLSKSVVAVSTGWQYDVWEGFLIRPLLNAALYDFEWEHLNNISNENLIFGAGGSIGFLSAIGPLEVTFAYSPQTKRVLGYINLGWSF